MTRPTSPPFWCDTTHVSRTHHRLIVYPPRRCGSVRSVERSWRWLTNRLPVVRGLASERGASGQGLAVAWLEGGVNAGPAVAESDMPTTVHFPTKKER